MATLYYLYRFTLLLCLLTLVGCLPLEQHQSASQPAASQILPASMMEDIIIHNEFSERADIGPVPEGIQGDRGIGFIREEHIHTPIDELPQNEEFHLDAEMNTFEPFLVLMNNTDQPKTFLVTLMFNYRQVPFTFNEQFGLLHLIEIPPFSNIYFPMSVPISETGRHDIQAVMFEDPFNLRMDYEFRRDVTGYAMGQRIALTVGNDHTPARTFDVLDLEKLPVSEEGISLDVMFRNSLQNQASDSALPHRALIHTDTVQLEQPYPLQIIVSSDGEYDAGIKAVIPFLNYRQIALEGQDVIVTSLGVEEEAFFNTELALPEERGVHQLQAIYLVEPYANMLENKELSPFVKGSMRVAFIVE
ncbi:MAG: hypothetical protein AAGF95_16735 [Chloroflexota bacterium]